MPEKSELKQNNMYKEYQDISIIDIIKNLIKLGEINEK
jgi:hypothetical protein